MSAPKVLAIGLDGADRRLLLKWCGNGRLPHLKSLLDDAQWGQLRSPPGFGDEGVWASFATARPPGEHGRWFRQGLTPDSYDQIRIRPEHYRHSAFWHALDAEDISCSVVDVPKAPQQPLAHGVAVYDWRVHGIDAQPRSHPPSVAEDLLARYGIDPIDRPGLNGYLCSTQGLSKEQHALWFDHLQQGIRDKTTACEALLETPRDLFLAVFKESHCAGHRCYPVDDALESIYGQLDDALGALLRYTDDKTTVIVFTPLGMDNNFHGTALLDTVLRRLERVSLGRVESHLIDADILYHRIARRLRRPASGHRHRRRLYYQVDGDELAGAIRINVKGRERHGRVRPGQEYADVMAFLTSELLALTNPATGRPVVAKVLNSDDMHAGPARAQLPDLLAIWHRDAPIDAVHSPTIGTVRAAPRLERPGNHVPGGMYIARGPHIRPGKGASADIADLGATMAAILGAKLPDVPSSPIAGLVPGTV